MVGTPGTLPVSAQRALNFVRNLPRLLLQFFQWVWTKQRHWLIPLVPFAFLVYRPFHLTWSSWFSPNSLFVFQPFVPLLAFYMAWERRQKIAAAYNQFCSIWPPESKRRRGHVWLAVFGCLLMMAASLAIVPSLAVLSLVVMVVGIIYYVYGWYVIGLLILPLAFLFLMTPPGNVLNRFFGPFQMGNAIALSGVLHSFMPSVQMMANVILLPNVRFVITPELGGVGVVLASLVLTLWLGLRREIRYFNYPVVLLLALVLALIVNFVRLFFLALIMNSNPVFGGNLMKLPSWILVLVTFLFLRPLVNLFRPRLLSSIGEGE